MQIKYMKEKNKYTLLNIHKYSRRPIISSSNASNFRIAWNINKNLLLLQKLLKDCNKLTKAAYKLNFYACDMTFN